MNIPPWFGIIVSGISTGLLGLGTTVTSDPTSQKVVIVSAAVGNILSLIAHAFSSAQAGPLASPPIKP